MTDEAGIRFLPRQTLPHRPPAAGKTRITIRLDDAILEWYRKRVHAAGDGGAYFLGFAIAELAVLVVQRNSDVSPWFALLALWYPAWETLFSMYRRKVVQGRSTAAPDGLHLHTLVYHRVVKGQGRRSPAARGALTTLIMLGCCLLTVLPAWLFWDETWVLQLYAAAFPLIYLWVYQRIVRFGVPWSGFLRRAVGKGAARRARHSGGTL